ncbi:MAG: hypothetical protein Q8O67_32085 [Deltaproteobacteria bacterium]|nr:hypothetical protein [Deltaproteobacteria bacterium]
MIRSGQHLPTVVAAAVVAYLTGAIAHEAVGHAATCVNLGGDLVGVSSTFSDCDQSSLSPWEVRLVKAAGTIANLIVGVFALGLLHLVKSGAAGWLCWLIAAVNLFKGGGYLMVDPLFGFGDWTAFIDGLEPRTAWRIGLTTLGLAISLLSLRVMLRAAAPWLGRVPETRVPAGRVLMLFPYFVVGGGAMSAAAALNYLDLKFMFTGALATLGGTSFLAWMYFLEPKGGGEAPVVVVQRSKRIIIAGVAALLVLIAFGCGFQFGPAT